MKKKILLIDDDVDLIELNKALLTVMGYEVLFAYNGREGLDLVAQCAPDLIILDVMMNSPGEGFEVARAIKENKDTRHIPIIMLSAVNNESGFSLRVGPDKSWNPVDAFIDKPVRKEQLIKTVRNLLAK
ncbi:MAG TPA: response regulator [bacterium]|nr:response regulator [bacterium]HPN34305.1 response regulator [bacterium]